MVTNQMIAAGFFAFTNVILNFAMILYLYRINKGITKTLNHHDDFADAMYRIDKVSTEHAMALDGRIQETMSDVSKRIDFLTRWQKIIAKMIKEDLELAERFKNKEPS